MNDHPTPHRRVARFVWIVLGATVAVILWGGFVRATGAGAGCGANWPLCNGEVIPRTPALNTLIEFTHRVTSGILGLAVFGLIVAVFRVFPRRTPVRKAALAMGGFLIVEALLGAGLVLFEYVALDARVGRASWMVAHLINTFFLLGFTTLTALLASGAPAPRLRGPHTFPLIAALFATMVLGASGAVTALGDTLLFGGLDPGEHPFVATLVGLRVYHPLLAFVVLAVVAWAVWPACRSSGAGRHGRHTPHARLGFAVLGLFVLQMIVGGISVLLHAPLWIQLLHLFVTDLIWIGLVAFAVLVASPESRVTRV